MNQPNNCCLGSLKSKDLVWIKLLQTTCYLCFSMNFFFVLVTLKNLDTMF